MTPQQNLNKKIIVDLDNQLLYAYEGKTLIYKLDCASGDEDHPTPVGTFKIYSMDEKHFSHTYKVQMDHAMFFHKGYAIHQSHAVGAVSLLKYAGFNSFGSHGCVRLSESDAIKIFEWSLKGTPVVIKKVYTISD